MPDSFLILDLPDESATEALARDVAAALRVGDTIALSGGVGSGKTTLARALLRALADDPTLEVPSPTFTLVQTYATPLLTVAHVDLYRINDPREIDDAGLFDAVSDGAIVVEWPEHAGGRLPGDRLDVALEMAGIGRRARLWGTGDWPLRLVEPGTGF